MGEFTYYDANSYRSGEANLLKVKEYTDAYELVQRFGGAKAKEYIDDFWMRNEEASVDVELPVGVVKSLGGVS